MILQWQWMFPADLPRLARPAVELILFTNVGRRFKLMEEVPTALEADVNHVMTDWRKWRKW